MIICLCNHVTSKDLDDCIARGITKYYDVQAETKAGRTCGSCAPNVIDYIHKKKSG